MQNENFHIFSPEPMGKIHPKNSQSIFRLKESTLVQLKVSTCISEEKVVFPQE